MKSSIIVTIMGLAICLGTSATCIASSVALNWNLNSESDLAGYRIYYKADSPELPFDGVGAIEGAAPIDVAIQTSATINGLDPGRTYYFAVTAYNTEGFESAYSNVVAKVSPVPDTTAPDVTSFTIPEFATPYTIPIYTFTAGDNVGVIGYLITESATRIPAVNDAGWAATPPTTYTFTSEGSKMLYAWAKDNAGNISNAIGRTVSVSQSYTISDALLALRIAVKIVNPTQEEWVRTDVAPIDGTIDIRDALGILRDVVGLQKLAL